MRRLRRFTALLANLLLLQLVLVGSGAGSECTEHRAGATHEMRPMSGHLDGAPAADMAGADAPTPKQGAAAGDAPAEPSDGHAPCHVPWAPGGCATMVSCATAMVTTASAATEFARSGTSIIGGPRLAPRGPVSPPEPPPPRA